MPFIRDTKSMTKRKVLFFLPSFWVSAGIGGASFFNHCIEIDARYHMTLYEFSASFVDNNHDLGSWNLDCDFALTCL